MSVPFLTAQCLQRTNETDNEDLTAIEISNHLPFEVMD